MREPSYPALAKAEGPPEPVCARPASLVNANKGAIRREDIVHIYCAIGKWRGANCAIGFTCAGANRDLGPGLMCAPLRPGVTPQSYPEYGLATCVPKIESAARIGHGGSGANQ